jgi:hypothetical protein
VCLNVFRVKAPTALWCVPPTMPEGACPTKAHNARMLPTFRFELGVERNGMRKNL